MKNKQISITTITTPQRFLLKALFLGDKKAKNIFIYLHGLGGSIFSQSDFLESLIDSRTAVLTFNNRGHDIINRTRRINVRKASGQDSVTIGMAHEVFSDCVDDIDGAINWAKKAGFKNIYLIGHSTGCQKSIYYLSKRENPAIKGAVLLAPISDYADTYALTDKKVYNRALASAKKMVKEGKKHELIPSTIWLETIDAQRWLSLYTADSQEEIFSYASKRNPITLLKNRKPLLIFLAEKDEFSERPMSEIANWFKSILKEREAQIKIIKNAPHYFSGSFNKLKNSIKKWVLTDKV